MSIDQLSRGMAANALGAGLYRNLKTYYGAAGDGVADDTAALNKAAADFNIGYSIYIPEGKYNTATGITLSQNFPYQGQCIIGAGYWRSCIVVTANNVNGITISGSPYFTGNFEKFSIHCGGPAGSLSTATGGIGIYSAGGPLVHDCSWRDLYVWADSHCIYVDSHFCQEFTNVIVDSSKGHGFCLKGGNTVQIRKCYAEVINGSHMAGYRIAGSVALFNANGLNAGDYWGVFGATANVTGTAQAGSTSTTIVLASGSTFVTDQTKAFNIRLTGGTGSGQTRLCTAYNQTTKTATITPAWTTTPDATSTYSVEDPVSFCQANIIPKVFDLASNHEQWNIDAVRTVATGDYTLISGIFQPHGNYQYSLHFYSGYEPGSNIMTIIHTRMAVDGTRSGTQDIAVDSAPPGYIIGIGCMTGAAGQLNKYYDVGNSGTRYFHNFHSKGLHLAASELPTADPADGSGSVWCDVSNSSVARVLRLGS